MKINLTTVIEKAPEGGYFAWIEEIPGVNTQGETIDETRINLLDALDLMLKYRREEAEKKLSKKKKSSVKRERYKLVSAA